MSHIKGYVQFISEDLGVKRYINDKQKSDIKAIEDIIRDAKDKNLQRSVAHWQKKLDQIKKYNTILGKENSAPNGVRSNAKSADANDANLKASQARRHQQALDAEAKKGKLAATPVVTTPVVTKPVVSTPVVTKPVVSTPVVTKPVVDAAKKQEPFQMSSGRGNEALRARNIAKAKARKQNPTVNTKPTLNKAGTDSGSGVDALKQRMIKRSEERGK